MICRRVIITEEARRTEGRNRRWQEDNQFLESLQDQEELPRERILRQERQSAVRAGLDRLPEADRQIILLAFEQDLSRRYIAAILDKPSVSAVTSHLHRAMHKLMNSLDAEDWLSPSEASTVQALQPTYPSLIL